MWMPGLRDAASAFFLYCLLLLESLQKHVRLGYGG